MSSSSENLFWLCTRNQQKTLPILTLVVLGKVYQQGKQMQSGGGAGNQGLRDIMILDSISQPTFKAFDTRTKIPQINSLIIDFQAYETKIILRGSSDSIEAARNMIMEKVNNGV